jgi:hypothetical protein
MTENPALSSFLTLSQSPTLQEDLISILSLRSSALLQIEAALLLHNIPLFLAILFTTLPFLILSYFLTVYLIPPLVYVFLCFPLFQLLQLFQFARLFRLLFLPVLPSDSGPRRIRSIEELVRLFWGGISWAVRNAGRAVRAVVSPGPLDCAFTILGIIVADIVCQAVNPFLLLAGIEVIVMVAPGIITLTPIVEFVTEFQQRIRRVFTSRKWK